MEQHIIKRDLACLRGVLHAMGFDVDKLLAYLNDEHAEPFWRDTLLALLRPRLDTEAAIRASHLGPKALSTLEALLATLQRPNADGVSDFPPPR